MGFEPLARITPTTRHRSSFRAKGLGSLGFCGIGWCSGVLAGLVGAPGYWRRIGDAAAMPVNKRASFAPCPCGSTRYRRGFVTRSPDDVFARGRVFAIISAVLGRAEL